MMQHVTPVLIVETIEPSVTFWTERLGFEPANAVPHGDRLGFVMLVQDDVTIMYQSRSSLESDMRPLAEAGDGKSAILFVRVDDVERVANALAGADIVVPRRTTFYGADEIGIREPGGHIVIFAQFAAEE